MTILGRDDGRRHEGSTAMKKYLVLYRSTMRAADIMASHTPEQGKAEMAAWMEWAQRAGSAIVDLGTPLGSARRFSSATESSAGDVAIGGYSVLQAADDKALQALLDGHPHFRAPGGTIETFEFLPMPGM
jgi:hypothetical protein